MDIVNRCLPPLLLVEGHLLAVIRKNRDCIGTPICQVVQGNPQWMKGSLDYRQVRHQITASLHSQGRSWLDIDGRWIYRHRRLKSD